MAEARQNEPNATNCVGVDAALSPLHLPASARRKAGIPTIPRQWCGRLEKLPVVLRQIFMPLLQPNLESLQRGEIQRTGVFIPRIGAIEVKWKGDEVWVSFVDALAWGQKILQHRPFLPLHCAIALLPEAQKAGCGFGYPNNLFFHTIAA
jgi:hypothetical protein